MKINRAGGGRLKTAPTKVKSVVVYFVGAAFSRPLCLWFAGVFCKVQAPAGG